MTNGEHLDLVWFLDRQGKHEVLLLQEHLAGLAMGGAVNPLISHRNRPVHQRAIEMSQRFEALVNAEEECPLFAGIICPLYVGIKCPL